MWLFILVGYCRSTEEMELVLKQTKGSDAVHLPFPRLVLAIDYKQKRFVSHPNTQQVCNTNSVITNNNIDELLIQILI